MQQPKIQIKKKPQEDFKKMHIFRILVYAKNATFIFIAAYLF